MKRSSLVLCLGAAILSTAAGCSTEATPAASGTGGAGGTGGSSGSGGSIDAGGGTGGVTGMGGSGGATGQGGSGGAGGAKADARIADSSAGGAGGGAPADITIKGPDGTLDNAFLITSCSGEGTGYDCPNRLQGQNDCPSGNWAAPAPIGDTSEPTGTTYSQSYTVGGGDAAATYAVTVRVRGQVEPRSYTGGMRQSKVAANPTGTNDLLHIGGRPGTTRVDYNVFMMTIEPPAGGKAIPNAPTFYAFNSVTSAHEGSHYNLQVDETFTIRVRPGFTVTLTNHDSNCIAIQNCGPGGPYNFASAQMCEAQARTIAGVTLPKTYRGASLPNGGSQPFQTQFLQFTVVKSVAE